MLRYAVHLLVIVILLFSGGEGSGVEGNPLQRSGRDFLPPQLRTMQDDDDQNPAFLWVDQALETWTRIEGKARRDVPAKAAMGGGGKPAGRYRAPSPLAKRHGPAGQSGAADQLVSNQEYGSQSLALRIRSASGHDGPDRFAIARPAG